MSGAFGFLKCPACGRNLRKRKYWSVKLLRVVTSVPTHKHPTLDRGDARCPGSGKFVDDEDTPHPTDPAKEK